MLKIDKQLLRQTKEVFTQLRNDEERDRIMLLVCAVRDPWSLGLSAGYSSLLSLIHDVSCWDAAIALVCS